MFYILHSTQLSNDAYKLAVALYLLSVLYDAAFLDIFGFHFFLKVTHYALMDLSLTHLFNACVLLPLTGPAVHFCFAAIF